MVFKKSPLLLLLTPFPNYFNGIVKKEKKTLQQDSNKKTKTENILINSLNNKQKITNNLKSLDVKLRSIASEKTYSCQKHNHF